MNAPKSPHWLQKVAHHAGLDLHLPETLDPTAIRDAWAQTARACRLPDDRFTQKVAEHFRIGVADVSTYDPQAVKLIPESVARAHGILAMSATESNVVVATSDPMNRAALRDVVAHASRQPVLLLASPANLAQALERAYAPARAPRNALQTLVAQVAATDFQVITNQGMGVFTSFELEDPSVVKLTDLILQQGLRYRATEIHIEPGKDIGRVRYRIDDVLQHVVDLPVAAHTRLVARLKHIAFDRPGADPEEGFDVEITNPNRRAQARLISTPTPDGELVWIHLIDPHEIVTLDDLGFHGAEAHKIRQIISKQDGLVLVTGPARSGTTNFIYAMLHELEGRSTLSLEGRPERVIPGVTQIRYEPSSGLSFAQTLQQLLDRQPDVLHAGEIRDLPTARIVLRTAVTGRKVIANVHTSDAVSGVRRLIDMGLAAGRLGESLHAVVSLRLVRRLCQQCARPYDPARHAHFREAKLALVMGVAPVKIPIGCKACAGTGYREQIPIPETLVVTPAMRAALAADADDDELLRVAHAEGMRTFAEVGLELVSTGLTTVEELERVLGIVPSRDETARSAGPVLVVDDEKHDRDIVGGVLRGLGFEVVEADGVPAARELLRDGEHDFCLVVTDHYMPDENGIELLRSIRQSLTTQSLPVIFLTVAEGPEDEVELLKAGADDYLAKPVDVHRLDARVRAVLRRAGVRIAVPE